jgi:sulfur-oxidizing protein SoxZ
MPKAHVKIPASAKVGDIIEVKAFISHLMETGRRKTPDGKPIPRKIINTVIATYAGSEVFKAELYPDISANPYLAFFMKVPGPGEFELTWVEDGGNKTVEKVKLNVT